VNGSEVSSRGMTEEEVLQQILGTEQTHDRITNLVAAIHRLEDLTAKAPLQLRVLWHGVHATLKPEVEQRPDDRDVWLAAGELVTREDPPTDPKERLKWRRKVKTRAWRAAHPYGLEVEPPEGDPIDRIPED
jgi:hypothetical protein